MQPGRRSVNLNSERGCDTIEKMAERRRTMERKKTVGLSGGIGGSGTGIALAAMADNFPHHEGRRGRRRLYHPAADGRPGISSFSGPPPAMATGPIRDPCGSRSATTSQRDGMVGEDTYSPISMTRANLRAPLNGNHPRTVGAGPLATPSEYGASFPAERRLM